MSENTAKSEDRFENGYFWQLYKDLEHQFEDFLEYVPYMAGNENTCSFRLLNLILGIGGHVDSGFKEMARYAKFSENPDCQEILEGVKARKSKIEPCLRAFEKEYKLSKRKVLFKYSLNREEIIPFKPFNKETKAPEWWEFYNGLKHDVGMNVEKANLRNCRDALAAAFLLNVIHIPSCLWMYDNGILQPSYERLVVGLGEVEKIPSYYGKESLKEALARRQPIKGFVETSLFKYDYSQFKGKTLFEVFRNKGSKP